MTWPWTSGQAALDAVMIVRQLLMIEAKQVESTRRVQGFLHAHDVLHRLWPNGRSAPKLKPRLTPAPGEPGVEALGVVVAACVPF